MLDTANTLEGAVAEQDALKQALQEEREAREAATQQVGSQLRGGKMLMGLGSAQHTISSACHRHSCWGLQGPTDPCLCWLRWRENGVNAKLAEAAGPVIVQRLCISEAFMSAAEAENIEVWESRCVLCSV